VPVSTKAKTPAKPDPEKEPGKCGEQQSNKVPSSEFWKNPTKGIKNDQ
jgi:hypothetical protein